MFTEGASGIVQTIFSQGRQLRVYYSCFWHKELLISNESRRIKRAKEISIRAQLVDVRLSKTSVLKLTYIPLLIKRLK